MNACTLYVHVCIVCTCSTVAKSPIAGQQPPLAGSTQQPSTGQPNPTAAATTGGGTKLESGSGSSLKSGQSADTNKTANDGSQGQSQEQGGSTSAIPSSGGEESTASIFLQTAAYLLDVHALKVHCMQIMLCGKFLVQMTPYHITVDSFCMHLAY